MGLKSQVRGKEGRGGGRVGGAIASPIDFEILPGGCPGRLGLAAYARTVSASRVEAKGTRCENLFLPTHNRKVVVREQEAMSRCWVISISSTGHSAAFG